MNDDVTTVSQLKKAVHDMCLKKGWGGETGIQNPQHVAMAMTVEMSELLEHFQWLDPDGVQKLLDGKDEKRKQKIAEEYADVMMYGLQLMWSLNIDVAHEIERKIDIVLKRDASWKADVPHT